MGQNIVENEYKTLPVRLVDDTFWDYVRSLDFSFFDFYPFEDLFFNHFEYLFKKVLTRFISIEYEEKTKTIMPYLGEKPKMAIPPIPGINIGGHTTTALFYANNEQSYTLAFETDSK